jgi:Holliday junction resolvase
VSKGSRREREAVELYQRAGFATYRPATVQYGENDVFGLFDLLAVSPSHDAVHAVQVKSNRATGIRAWARHTALWRRLGWRTFYLVPVDNEGWRVIEPVTAGQPHRLHYRIDERERDCAMGDGVVQWLRVTRVVSGSGDTDD